MTFLLLKVSGVTLLEQDIRERRPGYAEYVAQTSAFVPWPPRRSRTGALSVSSLALLLLPLLTVVGCGNGSELPPLKAVPSLDLARFMGKWYVIASIPTRLERGAHNAVESYALNPDGTVQTTFTFRDGGFDGTEKTYHPKGFIRDNVSKAVWGMQFIWPIKADYRVIYLTPDYHETVIARSARDYVWIMARSPQIDSSDYAHLLEVVRGAGYDVNKVQAVPQRWPSTPQS
jgi:apolipoprotein D and lipocalin family protein